MLFLLAKKCLGLQKPFSTDHLPSLQHLPIPSGLFGHTVGAGMWLTRAQAHVSNTPATHCPSAAGLSAPLAFYLTALVLPVRYQNGLLLP